VIQNSSFSDRNYSTDDGGAVYIYNSSSISITHSTFVQNEAYGDDHGGGAIAIYNDGHTTTATITSSVFDGNYAVTDEGGALSVEANPGTVDLTVTSSTFTQNKSGTNDGGAIDAGSDSYLTITNSAFIDNYADGDGGALWVSENATIYSSLFRGNDAVNIGGAVYIDGNSSAVTRISGSSFIENGDDTAPNFGGGLYFWNNGPLEVSNSTFYGNEAESSGAGIYLFDSGKPYDDTIAYTTIVNNTLKSGTNGAGVYVSADDTITVRLYNSLLWNNDDSAGNASDFFEAGTIDGVLRNSLITSPESSNVTGTAMATGDPLLGTLADNGGPKVGDDSTTPLPTTIPAWNSPAVGIADPTLTPGITTTQLGSGYPRTGNVAGSMNASAAPAPPPPVFPPSAPLDVTGTAGDASATITWTAPASAGSFPITDYQAVLSPGGASCLVQAPALSCTITGLTNGTTYTATARALNGAGWGAFSAASEPFTPENPTPPVTKTIVITGTRGTVGGKPGVYADGETTGLIGATVQARVKLAGQLEYRVGSTRIVQPDGTFRWQRKTGKKVYVYFIADGGEVRSNRVIISAR